MAEGRLTILDLMTALKGWFRGETWAAWRACLAAIFGLSMSETEAAIARAQTGRPTLPTAPAREAWVIAGRRAGKSLVAALVAVYLAFARDYRAILAPGEVGTLMIIAADRRQARTVLGYIRGILDGVRPLGAMVQRQTRDAIELKNGVRIEIHTCSFRAVRGYTVIGVICDEIAFWRSEESANPDVEILAALRPAMATVPGAVLLCISSPYARRGALWTAWRAHYGRDGDPVLVWQANTRSMNPTVDEAIIQAALEQDEAAAKAEWLGEFRRDIETFVPREAVDAVVVPGRRELPAIPGARYVAFVDPSGGSQDSMTLAIAHVERREGRGAVVLDLVRERRPPFSPEDVVREFAELLRAYRCTTVRGDRYGGEWPREAFRKRGIAYELAEHATSDLYRELLPLINARTVELLDQPRLIAQLCNLERRTARSGRDSIGHGPGAGAHDDLVNAAAGALVLAAPKAVDPRAMPGGPTSVSVWRGASMGVPRW